MLAFWESAAWETPWPLLFSKEDIVRCWEMMRVV
jgi:hypothetical protein